MTVKRIGDILESVQRCVRWDKKRIGCENLEKAQVLERVFGYTGFRPGQEELIDGALVGRDVFGIMPTGGGKSVCYQVPALMLPGITLVVSPLISLMRDQVLALKAAGVSAAYINSTLTEAQMKLVYRNLLAGQYKLVYVAPERLDYSGFGSLAAKLKISFVAVDEAHCISQWGQDFRPSYLRIVNFIQSLPQRPVVGAFTATATKQVREDVERLLSLREPVRTVTGFDRPNLSFEVIRFPVKKQEILRLVAARRTKSGIIYCATRKKVESVCRLLQDKGYEATRYHAGLEEEERTANQEDFIHDRKPIMVATNAFGMGIDKSNVSFVIHYNMPKSMEAYYQEAGRAGRDGPAAECILLFNSKDVETCEYFISNSEENEELDEQTREQIRQQDLQRLEDMVSYCKTGDCLRGYILEYFGQAHPKICGNCGNCAGEYELADVTRQAQMLLSCVARIRDRLGYSVGLTTVAKVLLGSKDKKLLQQGLDSLSTYGLMKDSAKEEIYELAQLLEADGYLQTEQEHKTVRLTKEASHVLFQGKNVQMRVRKEAKASVNAARASVEMDPELYELLRQLRGELARENKIAAYMIFSNATLQDMAAKKPTNITQFKRVSGVGEMKAEWYGLAFTKAIREYLKDE